MPAIRLKPFHLGDIIQCRIYLTTSINRCHLCRDLVSFPMWCCTWTETAGTARCEAYSLNRYLWRQLHGPAICRRRCEARLSVPYVWPVLLLMIIYWWFLLIAALSRLSVWVPLIFHSRCLLSRCDLSVCLSHVLSYTVDIFIGGRRARRIRTEIQLFISHQCQTFLSATRSGKNTPKAPGWRRAALRRDVIWGENQDQTCRQAGPGSMSLLLKWPGTLVQHCLSQSRDRNRSVSTAPAAGTCLLWRLTVVLLCVYMYVCYHIIIVVVIGIITITIVVVICLRHHLHHHRRCHLHSNHRHHKTQEHTADLIDVIISVSDFYHPMTLPHNMPFYGVLSLLDFVRPQWNFGCSEPLVRPVVFSLDSATWSDL